MKTLKTLVLVVSLLALSVSLFAAGSSTESDPNIITLNIGTTDAASAANSGIFRVPRACKIDSVYITDLGGVASSAADYVTVTLFVANAAYGSATSELTSFVAATPRALVPTTYHLTAGQTVQAKLTKASSGTATTNMGVTIAYHNTDSN